MDRGRESSKDDEAERWENEQAGKSASLDFSMDA